MTRIARSKGFSAGGFLRSIFGRVLKSNDGSVLPIFAVSMVPLIGSVGLAVDLGRAASMHASLQATVDKAALSGAAAAFGPTSQTSAATPTGVGQAFYRAEPLPVWTSLTPATTAVTISGVATDPVYVKATSTAQIQPSFLSIWFNTITVSASATAAAGAPTSGASVFPFALGKCVLDYYWDSTTSEPVNNGPANPITLDSAYLKGGNDPKCTTGQWTSLTESSNSASYISGLISNGCGCTLNSGDDIFIATGTKDSLYQAAEALVGKTVLVPVVTADDLSKNSTGGSTTVYAFAPFHISGVVATGNDKSIQGYFVANYHPANAGGVGGVYYGIVNVELMQ